MRYDRVPNLLSFLSIMSVPTDPWKGRLDTVREIGDSAADSPGVKTTEEEREEEDTTSSTRIQSVGYGSAENIFADPEVAAHYAQLYEKAQYECRHVFDPRLEWTPQEERRLVRKLDRHVCLWAVSGVRN